MIENKIFNMLMIFLFVTFISSSNINIVGIPPYTPLLEPIVDGNIDLGEYDDGLYIPLTGPWPPDAPFSPSLVDGYLYWNTTHLWIAVDEPFPNWGLETRNNFVEFMWDPEPGSSSNDLHAWVLWDDGWWSHVICPKWGSWSTTSDPYPGTSEWAVGSAVEFKFDYTKYGTSYGDIIKLIVDTSEDASAFPPFGDCQIWPANPTYYPSETAESVETWGTILLDGNQPPVADAGGPYSGLVGEIITLDGSGSYDLDDPILSYNWDLDDDGFYDDATGINPTHSWTSEGIFPISLEVSDGILIATDDATVNIGDHAVDGIISPDEYDGGMTVTLADGLFTVDGYIDWDHQYLYVAVDEPCPSYIEFAFDADPLRDRWDLFGMFGSGSSFYQFCMKPDGAWGTSTSPSAFSAFSGAATEFKFDYTVFGIALGDTIKMCIERGSTPNAFWPEGGIIWQNPPRTPDISTWGDVTLTDDTPPPNNPPIADANGLYENIDCDYTITFDGTGSIDPDGTIVSYDWDFGDGTGWHNNIGPTPTHTYPTFGIFSVTLRVTDNLAAQDTDSTSAKVYGVKAYAGGPYILDTKEVHFDGSGSTGYETPLTYDWDFGDGSPHGTGVDPTHTYLTDGTYDITLTVTENSNGCSDIDTTTVTITTDNIPPVTTCTYKYEFQFIPQYRFKMLRLKVDLTATDEGVGEYNIYYRTSSRMGWSLWDMGDLNSPVTLSLPILTPSIQYYAIDGAGNIENIQTTNFIKR